MTWPSVVALLAVLAGDDPDVVAQPAHGFVGVPHVLVHPAGMRVAVRADDADLQRTANGGLAGPMDRRHDAPGRPGPRVIATLLWDGEYGAGAGPWRRAAGRRPRRCASCSSARRQARWRARRWPAGSPRRSRRGTRSSRCRRARARGRPSCRPPPGAGSRSLRRFALEAARATGGTGVEQLDRVQVMPRIGVVVQGEQAAAAEAGGQRRQRVRGDGQPALVVDAFQRLGQRPQGGNALLDEQGQHVAAARGDLLADDEVEVEVAARRGSRGRAARRPAARGR